MGLLFVALNIPHADEVCTPGHYLHNSYCDLAFLYTRIHPCHISFLLLRSRICATRSAEMIDLSRVHSSYYLMAAGCVHCYCGVYLAEGCSNSVCLSLHDHLLVEV